MNATIIIALLIAAFVAGVIGAKRILKAVHNAEASIHLRIARLESKLKARL